MKLMSHGCWEGQGTKSAWPFADTRPFAYAHTHNMPPAGRCLAASEWVSEREPPLQNIICRHVQAAVEFSLSPLHCGGFHLFSASRVPSMQMSVPATNVFSQAEETDSQTRWFINDICTYIWIRTSKSHQPLSTRIWICLLMANKVMSKVGPRFAHFTRAIRSLNKLYGSKYGLSILKYLKLKLLKNIV